MKGVFCFVDEGLFASLTPMARILLGVTGSISAYRAPDVVKALVAQGHEVQAVLTQSGAQFTTPKTLETFSGKKVLSNDSWDAEHLGTDHIKHARWAEVFVIYGATANFLAKLAHGFCDDFLSLQIMATKAPVLLVPAMNVEMWENAATQTNVKTLKERGYVFVGPIAGLLACGETGLGHVAATDDVLAAVKKAQSVEVTAQPTYFKSKKVLISLGSMRSDIDDVRFVQNKSSGRMGLEIARVLKNLGAELTLLAGCVNASVEQELKDFNYVRFESYEDYTRELKKVWASQDVFFSLAAVLDFVVLPTQGKIERGAETLSLNLKATEDMVAWAVSQKKPTQKVVSFSLESASTWKECLERAKIKLLRKKADLAIVNRAGQPDQGPDATFNSVCILSPDGSLEELSLDTKAAIAAQLLMSLSRRWY